MTATTPSGRTGTRIRWTGHPPPVQQIRDQIRSSTGVTYTRSVSAFSGGRVVGRTLALEAARTHARNVHALITLLSQLEDAGEALPYARAIATHIGDDWTEDDVHAALEGLCDAGDLDLTWGTAREPREFAVRLPGGTRVLRTSGMSSAIAVHREAR